MTTIDRPSFTCPECKATSWNPTDVREGYCGNCHEFTGTPDGLHRYRLVRQTELERKETASGWRQRFADWLEDFFGIDLEDWKRGLWQEIDPPRLVTVPERDLQRVQSEIIRIRLYLARAVIENSTDLNERMRRRIAFARMNLRRVADLPAFKAPRR